MVNPFEDYIKSKSGEATVSSNPFEEYISKAQKPYLHEKEEKPQTLGQRVTNYFTSGKLGEAASMQMQSGGPAGAPSLSPQQAKEVGAEVATAAAVEVAFAPIIGAAAASKVAPKILKSLAELTATGTMGGALTITSHLSQTGELPSVEEVIEEGATWMALSGIMRGLHLTAVGGKKAYDFGKAVNNIAKKEGVPPKDVLKKLWQSTQNYLKQKYGRTIESAQEIMPADVQALAEKTKEIEQRIFRPAGPSMPLEEELGERIAPEEGVIPEQQPQYSPEEQKITAPQEFLKSDYEIAQDIQTALSPLNIEENKKKPPILPNSIDRMLEPVQEELREISPIRVSDPNFIGKEVDRAIKRVSEQIYRDTSQRWKRAKDLASDVNLPRPLLVGKLREIALEAPSRAAGGEAKLQNFAQDLLDKLERKRGKKVHYSQISNEDLIKEIQQARVGYDYRFSGGVQGHRINEFIDAVEQELIRTSSEEAMAALEFAREGTKSWAIRFKNPNVLPFRSERLPTPQKNYERATSPDTFNIIAPILEEDVKGRHLLNLLRRNMLEKTLEPYLLRPKSFNPIKFERDMSKLTGIIPDDILQSLGPKMYQLHAQSLAQPEPAEKAPSFANIGEAQITSKLKTIQGLRELKKQLSQIKGGDELYREIAGTMGVDLLFGGQLDVPTRANKIKNVLNDRNGRPYIRETLGDENLAALDELVRKNDLEKRLIEVEESPTLSSIIKDPDILVKGSKVIWNILKGNPIKIVSHSVQLAKKVSKALKNKSEPTKKQMQNIEIK